MFTSVCLYFVAQHLQEVKYPGMDAILAETETMLAQGRMDMPITTCFAANRNDDLLLHRLLKKGSDPNEVDKNGKTALVCRFSLLKRTHFHQCLNISVYIYNTRLLQLYFLM